MLLIYVGSIIFLFCPQPTELSKNTPLPVGITEAASVFGTILEFELKGNCWFAL